MSQKNKQTQMGVHQRRTSAFLRRDRVFADVEAVARVTHTSTSAKPAHINLSTNPTISVDS